MPIKKWTRQELVNNINTMIDESQKAQSYYLKLLGKELYSTTKSNEEIEASYKIVSAQLSLLMEIRTHL